SYYISYSDSFPTLLSTSLLLYENNMDFYSFPTRRSSDLTSTMLVYTTGDGVNGFTLNPALGTFYLSHPNMQFPKNGKIYSINEGNYVHRSEEHTSELQSREKLVCRLLLEKKKNIYQGSTN